MPQIQIRRVYEAPNPEDGLRVLVDRLWPRGLSKSATQVNLWLKDIAPSDKLRQWFNHDPARWEEFLKRYGRELEGQPKAVRDLKRLARKQVVTLLYAARDREHNNAVALRKYLES
jgi:uncharacterized protein YeaO (DUF488 family)